MMGLTKLVIVRPRRLSLVTIRAHHTNFNLYVRASYIEWDTIDCLIKLVRITSIYSLICTIINYSFESPGHCPLQLNIVLNPQIHYNLCTVL